ncbi:MAG: elongation factor 1-beta [Acidilobus sp.]
MARVAVLMTVIPSSIDVNLPDLVKEIERSLPSDFKLLSSAEEPLAFGIKALKLVVSMPEDYEGGTDSLEEAVRSVPGVEEVQVEAVTRLSS